MENDKEETPRWASVELIGKVSRFEQSGIVMLKLDVLLQDGNSISQLINPQSLYRITFCSEEIAKLAASALTAGKRSQLP